MSLDKAIESAVAFCLDAIESGKYKKEVDRARKGLDRMLLASSSSSDDKSTPRVSRDEKDKYDDKYFHH